MKQNLFEVLVRPKGRTAADEYYHKGQTWIEGRHNSSYVIELRNNHTVSVEAVVSVDGLAVTDGELASFASRGFVIPANSKITVEGWLVNNQQAAQFVFGHKNNSYAAQSSRDGNQGVIGVAWFLQMPVPVATAFAKSGTVFATPWIGHMVMGSNTDNSNLVSQHSVSTTGMTRSMGTGFGESVNFATTSVTFQRASQDPCEVMLIYYDSADNLQKMGIRLKPRTSSSPQAFPLSTGYCKPPPGWANKRW